MYTKQQASALRQAFYTAFGAYMAPVLSADQELQNWLNYKTGIRHIFLRLDTPNRGASIGFTLSHPDSAERLACYEQFLSLKKVLEDLSGFSDWNWEASAFNSTGQEISRIYVELTSPSVLNKNDWPTLISFFKERLIGLDAFWKMVKFQFEP